MGVFFGGLRRAACRVLVPGPGIEPCSLHWEPGVLTTGPPGKSHHWVYIFSSFTFNLPALSVFGVGHTSTLLITESGFLPLSCSVRPGLLFYLDFFLTPRISCVVIILLSSYLFIHMPTNQCPHCPASRTLLLGCCPSCLRPLSVRVWLVNAEGSCAVLVLGGCSSGMQVQLDTIPSRRFDRPACRCREAPSSLFFTVKLLLLLPTRVLGLLNQ